MTSDFPQTYDLVISNSTVLLSQLRWGGCRRLPMQVRVAATTDGILALIRDAVPAAVVLESALADGDAFTLCKEIRRSHPELPVVIVHNGSLTKSMWPVITASGCDEVLTAPMARGQLYEVLAEHLGLQRRRCLRVIVQAVASARDSAAGATDTSLELQGEIYDLSMNGARIRLPVPFSGGRSLTICIMHGSGQRTEVPATLIWQRSHASGVEMAVSFDSPDQAIRNSIAGLMTWRLVWRGDEQIVVIQQDLTETSDFGELAEQLTGKVVFDLKQVKIINSVGVSRWIRLVRAIPQGVQYSFEHCSPAFCAQAGYVPALRGEGQISSFFATYHCPACDAEVEHELSLKDVGGAREPTPPGIACRACGEQMEFDEMPERFFFFLK